jgi:hypothetical protein
MVLMLGLLLAAVLALGGCSIGGDDPDAERTTQAGKPPGGGARGDEPGAGGEGPSARGEFAFPPAPALPAAESDPALRGDLSIAARSLLAGVLDDGAVDRIATRQDPRLAWAVADLLRFAQGEEDRDALVPAFERLTGVDPSVDPSFAVSPWLSVTNHLLAWDLPAPPDYRTFKADLLTTLEPGWEPFFADRDAEIDLRLLSWGGVLIDDRAEGSDERCPRGCIPALDDPALTDAAGGAWYPDERIVFGVVVGGEAVALPRNVMEVHEMVNITIGGRRLGIPYCTLCGSAQAYLTDGGRLDGESLVLRTSGLLSRSNKVTYELRTKSVIDTFTGEALSGPLRRRGVALEQIPVVTSSWAEWKRSHPETRIVAEDGGIGREYPLDPLGGRDEDGPIFPVGPVDPRLGVQHQVLGVVTPEGKAVAFPADRARRALARDEPVELDGVIVAADAGGLVAQTRDGRELASHEAFWFAWSQFHPDTDVWTARP